MQTFDIRIYAPGERPDEFWQLAAPVFGSAQAQRELGGPFTDDGQTTWALALAPSGELAGLASIRVEGGAALLDHAYVRPEFRRQGVHGQLLAARIGQASDVRTYRVQANPHSLTALIRLGFVGGGRRGKYVLMEADGTILRARLQRPAVRVLN